MTKAHNAGKAWTNAEQGELIRMYNEGQQLDIIAAVLGRSGSAVVSKLNVLGILQCDRDGHYYPKPSTPWASWQEVRLVDSVMKE